MGNLGTFPGALDRSAAIGTVGRKRSSTPSAPRGGIRADSPEKKVARGGLGATVGNSRGQGTSMGAAAL